MRRRVKLGLCVGVGAGLLAMSVAAAEELPKTYTETVRAAKGKKSVEFDMVLIPGGRFTLGSPAAEAGRKPHEGPAHQVELKPFYLAATETTLDLFLLYYDETYTKAKGAEAKRESKKREALDGISTPTLVYGNLDMNWGVEGRPAVAMTWLNAVNFCRWLSKKTGKTYRLPTEAEWEYAARAGTQTAYFFGDDPAKLEDYAWFKANAGNSTQPVAQKQPNPWGLYDMLGNVMEWVADLYSPDAYAADAKSGPAINPTGPREGKAKTAEGFAHVARGGSWDLEADALRCAARDFEEPWWRMKDPQSPKSEWWLPDRGFIGFRVAASIEEERK